jgi:hypothetical protein
MADLSYIPSQAPVVSQITSKQASTCLMLLRSAVVRSTMARENVSRSIMISIPLTMYEIDFASLARGANILIVQKHRKPEAIKPKAIPAPYN